jgi:hypothetical protein
MYGVLTVYKFIVLGLAHLIISIESVDISIRLRFLETFDVLNELFVLNNFEEGYSKFLNSIILSVVLILVLALACICIAFIEIMKLIHGLSSAILLLLVQLAIPLYKLSQKLEMNI